MSLAGHIEQIAARNGATVVRQPGRGGMGCVYLVRDDGSGEERALKIMVPEIALDADARRLFLREIANARALTHEHIVRAYDAGEIDGALFPIMKYCDGGSADAGGFTFSSCVHQPSPSVSVLRRVSPRAGGTSRSRRSRPAVAADRGEPERRWRRSTAVAGTASGAIARCTGQVSPTAAQTFSAPRNARAA